MIGDVTTTIPEAFIWALGIGAFAFGAVIGMLAVVVAVWDMRFDAGRKYGYGQGREWREDQDALSRIRRVM